MKTTLCVLLFLVSCFLSLPSAAQRPRPNILFIALDDLNDWTGCLGGHPQARTPNLDRLAASGVLFTNAHCPGASCNPSRTAIFTGRSPHKSGLYDNGQKMREVLPDAEIIPKTFSRHGYREDNIEKDPHEWNNLAAKPKHAAKLAELRALAPATFAPKPKAKDDSLPALTAACRPF